MAAGCYGGRRLSELLQEQQEPFLLHHATTEVAPPCCSKNADATGRRCTLSRAVRRRVVCLAGCFSCTARESFRRLPRAGNTGGSHCDDDDDDGGRRLSPVSVMDVLRYSDEESQSSPTLSNWEEDDDETSSTSESSPASVLLTGGATSTPINLLIADEKTHRRAAEESTTRTEEEHRIISSWERIAGDIARVPALAELDLSSNESAREWMWQQLGMGEASQRIGARIEAMIFEEVRTEAVHDMLSLDDWMSESRYLNRFSYQLFF
ncbi:unnamed protein product [Alopecurus aequalis]